MSTDGVIQIPEKLHSVFGVPEEERPNVYLKRGSLHHAQGWFLALLRIVGDVVSVPNVSLFVPVSRNAIHKRINEGKLSCFKFQLDERDPTISESLNRERPHAFVPVFECKLWFQEYHDRETVKIGGEGPDWMLLDSDHFLKNSFMGLHSKGFDGLGEKEYVRLVEEYFNKRKEKYGW